MQEDNVIPFPQSHMHTDAIAALPCDTELPQDTGEVEYEYLGQYPTLARYKIMADPYGWYVLCCLPDNKVTPWVVWYYNAENNSYSSGDYHYREIEARNAFKIRINTLEHN